eukprot:GGOE01061382.1.p1 GENE.GGOE01061382.1~~GGOE01061382.1.p1  ORF type:complete len:282 (+),score=39.04 GGOE01061382.1:24-869(+)
MSVPVLNPSSLLQKLRLAAPLTMCIQNYVAMDLSANVLIAAGASPAMVNAAEECADFCRISASLSVNVGTALTPHWLEAMDVAVKAAASNKVPWVLDPVGMGATEHRNRCTLRLLEQRPTVVRGNASEILALAGGCQQRQEGPGRGKGVDAVDDVDEAGPSAISLAKRYGCVIAVSGPVDFITDGRRVVRISNGTPLLARITASGCALSSLCAAYLAVAKDNPLGATVAAFLHYCVAAEQATTLREVRGPGTLRVHLLDCLHSLTPETLEAAASFTVDDVS